MKNNINGVIILPDYIVQKFPHIKDLEKIFNSVLLYENGILHAAIHSEKLIDVVNQYFDQFIKTNRISLENCDEIIVAGAQEYFGIYLASNQIPFTMMEDAAGLISRPEIIAPIVKGISENRYRFVEMYGLLTGKNNAIRKIMCNMDVQADDYEFDKHEHFDVVVEMSKLTSEQLNVIKKFFGVEQPIEIEPNSALILTQHFYTFGLLSFQQQKEIYQTLLDYFFVDKNIVIKPHPDDVMYYKKLFPNSRVIRERFPSELIPYVFTNEPSELVTITSTSVDALAGYKKPIRFTKFFEQNYSIIHGYYIALYTILNAMKDYNMFTYNTDDILIENLMRYSNLKKKVDFQFLDFEKITEGKNVVLVDDIFSSELNGDERLIRAMNVCSENTVFIFLNSTRKYIFYSYPNKDVFSYISPIVWEQKKAQQDKSKNNVLLIYSKNYDIRRELQTMALKYKLPNLNQEIETRKLNDLEIRIKVLEGILEATEKRLDHYIKLESELRKQLVQKS